MTRGFIFRDGGEYVRRSITKKTLDAVLYKWSTWEHGWLRSVSPSLQSDQTLLFSHII